MSDREQAQVEDLDVDATEARDVKGGSLNYTRGTDLQKKATIATVGTPDTHSYMWGS